MKIVKLGYADGTHYVTDKDKRLLVVKLNGRVDLRCVKSEIPKEVLEEANAEAKAKREEFVLKWNKLSIDDKYCKMLDFFSLKPISEEEANEDWCISNSKHLTMEEFISKWEEYYINNVY